MTNISEEIKKLKEDAARFMRRWERHYTVPYVEHYWSAYDSFVKYKGEQAKIDKALMQLKLDLAITALTICGGNVMSAVMGSMIQKQASVQLGAICRESMEKTFSNGNLTSSNKILEHTFGKAGQLIMTIAPGETKKIISNEYLSLPAQQSFIKKPHTKQSTLKLFLLKSTEDLERGSDALLSSNMSDQQKMQALTEMKRSHFCNPPKTGIFGENHWEWIELTFYLKLLLNSDKLVTRVDSLYGMGNSKTSKPILDAPNSNKYPDQGQRQYMNDAFGRSKCTYAEYDRTGQTIIDRMNELYGKLLKKNKFIGLIDSKWFGEKGSKEILIKAYNVLKMISARHRNRIASPNTEQID